MHTCALTHDAQVAGVTEVRVIGVACARAGEIVSSWSRVKDCKAPAGGSRVACSIERYRCLGTTSDRGLAVSCASLGRSISFIARHG